MKTINDKDWLDAVVEKVDGINAMPEEDMFGDIMALASGRRYRRRAVILSIVGLCSAAAILAICFLPYEVDAVRDTIPSPSALVTVAAPCEIESETAATSMTAVRTIRIETDSEVWHALELKPEFDTLLPVPQTPQTENSQPEFERAADSDYSDGPSAWDPIVWSREIAAEEAKQQSKRRLMLSIGSNASFNSRMSGNPIPIALSSIKADREYAQHPYGQENFLLTRSESERKVISNSARNQYIRWFCASYPISLDIALSYDITDRTALESGVCYTLMTSVKSLQFESTGDSYEDRYNLDFLGIPLSVRYSFGLGKNLSAYLRIGGKVEKLMSTGALTPQFANCDVDDISRTPFWSVSGGAGIQYDLNSNAGIYIEPDVSYHFSNDMNFMTPYYNSPFALDFHAGLRVNLK